MSSTPVRNVSDTARWVAAYRALESAREDAIFRDPLAERLAGERGRAIAQLASVHNQWALITRTRVIDDLIAKSVSEGTECVLNLAAGFDTRPYRLTLPRDLLWVEVDLPALIEEKEEVLRQETPRCKLERVPVDLADAAARAELFQDINGRANRTLAITEGLVVYLETEMVVELAKNLAAQPSFKQWQAEQVLSLAKEARGLRRLPRWMHLLALLPQPDPRQTKGQWSVIAQFKR